MLLIGDVHGCYKTLRGLLKKCPRDSLCFVGDLIDRGPSPGKVVKFVREKGYYCIRGNHEDMMFRFLEQNDPHWVHPENGGETTLESYSYARRLKSKNLKQAKQDILELEDIQWLKNLPYYLEFPELKNHEGRYLVVSHSSAARVWDNRLKLNKGSAYRENFQNELLWGRPKKIEDRAEIYNVFGHTPVPFPVIREHYSNIDTGCFLGREYGDDYGQLTALQFPEMRLFSQRYID